MHVMSTPSRQKSWQTGRERVSVLAALAVQRDTVSRKLAELREQHKPPGSDKALSQERAAAMVGVTGRQWQRWEAGESVPYPRNLSAIAETFHFSVSDFFDGDQEVVATSWNTSPNELADQLKGIRLEFRGDVDVVLERLREIEAELEAARIERLTLGAEIKKQNELLTRQSKILAKIEQLVAPLEGVSEVVSEPAEAEKPKAPPMPPPPPRAAPEAPPRTGTTGQADRPIPRRRRKTA